ncbi:hypothetical protein [Pseudomonas phage Rollin]|nr:hypothetical protein [Pseudomonas phage Rollin]
MSGVFNRHKGGFDPSNAILIGRPSKWGNPFVIGQHGTRAEVIAKYEAWLMSQPQLVAQVKTELAGKDLVCYCAPAACHGDVLHKVANSTGADS